MELEKGKFWGRTEWGIKVKDTYYTGLTKKELIEKLAIELEGKDDKK